MIYSFAYVFIFSIALILIQKLDVSISPLFSLLITASIATIYFNIINKGKLKKIYQNCLNNKKDWISVMLIVLVMWSTTMIGPGKIGASLFNFIYFSWLGIIGLILPSKINWQENKIKFYFGMGLLLLLSFNIYIELNTHPSSENIYGIFLALAGGTSSFIYFKKSQALAKSSKLSATQILAVRFYLAIFILLLIIPKHEMLELSTISNFSILTILAFCSLIAPLYFSQKALEHINPEQHAIINSLCPLVTGILQAVTLGNINNNQIIIYGIYSSIIFCVYYIPKIKLELKR